MPQAMEKVSRRVIDPKTVQTTAALHGRVSPEEWETRMNLAACYRLLAHFGMTDMIFTHITARVPGPKHHLLINPYGFFFEDVTASNLVKFDLDGNVIGDSPYTINPVGFTFHTALHAAREDVTCVIHTHSRYAVEVSALKCGLLPVTQSALRFYGKVGYHDYEGLAPAGDELGRLAKDIGDRRVLVLRNHGLITAGRTIPEAFHLAFYFEECCKTQIEIMATGDEMVTPSTSVLERAKGQFEQIYSKHMPGEREWPALLRMIDRKDPSYRD